MVIGRSPMMRYMASKSPCWNGSTLARAASRSLNGTGADHLTDSGDAVLSEEHVLGTAQADTLSTQVNGLLCVARVVGVGHDHQSTSWRQPSP